MILISVPFRGSCSENLRGNKKISIAKISVPFRGSCSEKPQLAIPDFTRLQDVVCGADCFFVSFLRRFFEKMRFKPCHC